MTTWYNSYDDILDLAQWLHTKGEYFGTDAQKVMDYFEKPWHYENEWNEMQKELEAEEKTKEERRKINPIAVALNL